MAYYLGIDGGGSKTTCTVGDETSLLAAVTAGPSNITRVGHTRARQSLQQAIREACAAAKIDPRQILRACIGVAGAGRGEIASSVRAIVAELIPGEVVVVGDMQIALTAAFGAGPGVIVIAGTGSIAYGRDAQGKTARAGGWGFAISDEGSAHWIGRAAIGAVLRTADQTGENQAEPQPASLFRGLTAAWGLESLPELARAANANADFATLFPAVVAAAESGDAVARDVMTQASRELVQLAGVVVRRLFPDFQSSVSSAVPMAMAGGVFRHAPMIRGLFRDGVRTAAGDVLLNPEVVDPVQGALQMARRASS